MQSASLIDLDALPSSVRSEIEWALRRAEERQASDQKWDALLREGSDDEIIAEAQAEFGEYAPITLANRYERVPLHCEVQGLWTKYHPRRPVIQRGAKWARIASRGLSFHLSPNGWCVDVYNRALRMSKRTILDPEEFAEFAASLRSRLSDRYRLTDAFDKRIIHRIGKLPWGENTALIGGRIAYLSDSEYANIKSLHSIIKKTDKLDRRLELAREHMWERMAA